MLIHKHQIRVIELGAAVEKALKFKRRHGSGRRHMGSLLVSSDLFFIYL